jgi:hypothetical protein
MKMPKVKKVENLLPQIAEGDKILIQALKRAGANKFIRRWDELQRELRIVGEKLYEAGLEVFKSCDHHWVYDTWPARPDYITEMYCKLCGVDVASIDLKERILQANGSLDKLEFALQGITWHRFQIDDLPPEYWRKATKPLHWWYFRLEKKEGRQQRVIERAW